MLWAKQWASHKQFGVAIEIGIHIDETLIRIIDCANN